MRVSGAAPGHEGLRVTGHGEGSGSVRSGPSFGASRLVVGQARSAEERATYTSRQAGSPGKEKRDTRRGAQLRQDSGNRGGTGVENSGPSAATTHAGREPRQRPGGGQKPAGHGNRGAPVRCCRAALGRRPVSCSSPRTCAPERVRAPSWRPCRQAKCTWPASCWMR